MKSEICGSNGVRDLPTHKPQRDSSGCVCARSLEAEACLWNGEGESGDTGTYTGNLLGGTWGEAGGEMGRHIWGRCE